MFVHLFPLEEPVEIHESVEKEEKTSSSTHADLPLVGTSSGAEGPGDPDQVDPDPAPVNEARHESDDHDLVSGAYFQACMVHDMGYIAQ